MTFHKIIFLISQPRAGSTLVQRILGSHSKIATFSEPWIMLHPLYSFRTEGIEVEYDQHLYVRAITNFFSLFPNSNINNEIFYKGVRRMYGFYYDELRKISKKEYVLDKTPRYYNIIPELFKTFPNAKYIILLRNPLAVLSSMLRTWVKDDWFWFSNYSRRKDLVKAPLLLLDGINFLQKNCLVIRYETLIKYPEVEIQRMMNYLSIEYNPNMFHNIGEGLEKWEFGDLQNVYKFNQPKVEKIYEWRNYLDKPQIRRVFRDYLELLGPKTIKDMGYSYKECLEILGNPRLSEKFTMPFSFYLRTQTERNFFERNLVRFLKKITAKN